MKWIETKLRKGTKTPKICRDMFITSSCDTHRLCEVKNGRLSRQIEISSDDVTRLHNEFQLIARESSVFSNSTSRRTGKSWAVVDAALSGNT